MKAMRKDSGEWFEDETFWMELEPVLFPEEKFAEADYQIDPVLALAAAGNDAGRAEERFSAQESGSSGGGETDETDETDELGNWSDPCDSGDSGDPVGAGATGRAVLDLCCGPGRFAIPLALRGYQVTGVDSSAFLLKRAQERAERLGAAVEWVRADMREFVRPEGFDLALSLFNSFGYFEDRRDDLRVLEQVAASLKPHGVCVLDVAGKEVVAEHFERTLSHAVAGSGLLMERREVVDDWTRLRQEWTLLRKERTQTFRFEHTLYSGLELKERLLAAGFGAVRLYGDFDGMPYGPGSRHLVAVATKPMSQRKDSYEA